jgi:hypothetical protein
MASNQYNSFLPSYMFDDIVTIQRYSAGAQSSTGDYSATVYTVVSAVPAYVQPETSKLPVLKSGIEFVNSHRLYINKTSAIMLQANDIVTIVNTGEKFIINDPDEYHTFIPHYEAGMTTYIDQ